MEFKFFERALDNAEKGVGFTSPNPAVGAVIVKDGEIVAEGYHKKAGGDHAEIVSMKNLANSLGKKWDNFNDRIYHGLEMYVTLEPCCHYGKTGPCAEILIKAGFEKICVGMRDPNPKVDGGGIKLLSDAGIDVEVIEVGSEIEMECRSINQPFLKTMKAGLPFVCLKAGMSLDGKIATSIGESKWITSEDARNDSRIKRSKFDAVLVGSGTVLKDDCELAAHGNFSSKNLLRVIIDKDLSLDLDKRIFRDENVFVATTKLASEENCRRYQDKGVDFSFFGENNVDFRSLLKFLCTEKNIQSVFVEGGGGVHGHFYDQFLSDSELIDEVCFYIAPKLIGGRNSQTVIGGVGIKNLSSIPHFESYYLDKVGEDLIYCGYYNFW